ncbi:unnamed protein product [Clonostachys rosea f. rosea IK726]|uniref:Mitochondrial import inner membrane translocase subunit TIM54 n=2 Tax=Bionectria ochroleuca TaxID=29856 RepID=A0A0B7JLC0_BIOOC|nr:unnamed protein product [Clonostachys rosea f. rosea IK726]
MGAPVLTGSQMAEGLAKPIAPKPKRNPVFAMMGLPNLPKKLPSRNWMIFLTVTGAISAAIIYDKREKNRATAKWRRAVAPLADEKLSSCTQLPRKLTIYLESPPGDGFYVARNHFVEYVKPVLSSSGLDWEFVQGRMQGDVRAAVAEKIRYSRRKSERPDEPMPDTDEARLEEIRKQMGVPDYEGIKGDLVIGRHTWKEYVRGLHEGWLGPLDPPAQPEAEPTPVPKAAEAVPAVNGEGDSKPAEDEKKPEEGKEEEKKPERPPQPVPYNSIKDYDSAALPAQIPDEFSPSVIIPLPHRIGFTHTFVRLGRFFNRRKLADDIGREVAAACFAASREYRSTGEGEYEQQYTLFQEEKDWVKSVWQEEKPDEDAEKPVGPPKEKIWASPMVVDSRIVLRMRRFEITPEHEAKAAEVVVPETEIEGWLKGSLRGLWQWGASSFEKKPTGPNVGNLDDE